MQYITMLSLGLCVLLGSCRNSEVSVENRVAIGGKRYGGELKFMSAEKVSVLFPAYSVDFYALRVNAQIFEPLMRYDVATNSIVPGIAESYTVSDDAREYTFNIRKGALFHADDCFGGDTKELTANDVKFTLDFACSGLEENQISYLLVNRIKGGAAFYEKSKNSIPSEGVSGIQVVDDYTVKITLTSPVPGFERILSNNSFGIFAKDAYDKYGTEIGNHPVGSGPFMLEGMSDEKITLKRNPSYWRKDEFGNQLPFISKVTMSYSDTKKNELLLFRKSGIDFVFDIPAEEIENIFGTLDEAKQNVKHKVEGKKSMSMSFVGMACKSEEFSNPKVRKAFSMAINREEIIDAWLEGEGWAANHGFVPSMSGYDSEAVKGHTYNPEEAKVLMAEAGYNDGKHFPVLDFYVNAKDGSVTYKMCEAIAFQLKKNLNVNLKIKLCTLEEREKAIKDGSAKIWRSKWIADYPDPESFLAMFYNTEDSGNTITNSFNYRNDAFNALLKQSYAESDLKKRAKILQQCDQIIIDDAAVIPILTDDHTVIVNMRIRDFEASPMEYLSLTEVFIKEFKE